MSVGLPRQPDVAQLVAGLIADGLVAPDSRTAVERRIRAHVVREDRLRWFPRVEGSEDLWLTERDAAGAICRLVLNSEALDRQRLEREAIQHMRPPAHPAIYHTSIGYLVLTVERGSFRARWFEAIEELAEPGAPRMREVRR